MGSTWFDVCLIVGALALFILIIRGQGNFPDE